MSAAVEAKGLGPGAVLLHGLARNWWLLLLRGLLSIVFGVLAFIWPGITILTLVFFYGAYALVDGVFAVIAAIRGEGGASPRWWLAAEGFLGIAAGIFAFAMPGLTTFALLMLIAAWALVRGVFEIVGAIRLRKEIDNEWMLILSGLLSVLFGAMMLVLPGAGALALVWVIASWAVAIGIMLVILAFRLRKHAH
ncbi:MAG TPA: HdeD family acid-resistance protein [Rhizobiaceae bacterium]|nr:HdeD family acid-resistance protein [Rhizobiaceae bacterium]